MRIDMFCHIYPQKFLREYVRTQLPQLIRFLDAQTPNSEAYMVDDQVRIDYMDRHKIDIEVLTLAFQNCVDTVPEKDLMRITRLANDSLSEMVEKHPSRMIGIAMLPKLTGDALDELDRSITQLGLKGCVIFSNVLGKPVDLPEFMPFFEKMVRYDLPVLIHPTTWAYYDWIRDYRLGQIFGWPFDSSLAMGRIVFGGVLERYPNLKIVTHHLGGTVPFLSERIRGFFDEAVEHPQVYGSNLFPYADKMKAKGKHPLEYFKKFYADTVVIGSDPAMKCGLDFFGADHVVYATDYPFGTMKGEGWTRAITDSVLRLDISEEDRQKIFEKNARALLKIK